MAKASFTEQESKLNYAGKLWRKNTKFWHTPRSLITNTELVLRDVSLNSLRAMQQMPGQAAQRPSHRPNPTEG